jgi:hypothetical protein
LPRPSPPAFYSLTSSIVRAIYGSLASFTASVMPFECRIAATMLNSRLFQSGATSINSLDGCRWKRLLNTGPTHGTRLLESQGSPTVLDMEEPGTQGPTVRISRDSAIDKNDQTGESALGRTVSAFMIFTAARQPCHRRDSQTQKMRSAARRRSRRPRVERCDTSS